MGISAPVRSYPPMTEASAALQKPIFPKSPLRASLEVLRSRRSSPWRSRDDPPHSLALRMLSRIVPELIQRILRDVRERVVRIVGLAACRSCARINPWIRCIVMVGLFWLSNSLGPLRVQCLPHRVDFSRTFAVIVSQFVAL